MEIGKPQRTYTIEPIEDPIPHRGPAEPSPDRHSEPVRVEPAQPEVVPAR